MALDAGGLESCMVDFCLDIFKEIVRNSPVDNVFLSPSSIMVVMAMVHLGARGMTRDQMTKVLKFEHFQEQIPHDVIGNFTSSLSRNKQDLLLKSANRLFPSQSNVIAEQYIEKVRTLFSSDVTPMNFRQFPDKSRLEINKWVETETNGTIKTLLAPGIIDVNTALVVVNAVYFKARWASPFSKESTRVQNFYTSESNTVKVDMMHTKLDNVGFYVSEELGCSVLELPYGKDQVSSPVTNILFDREETETENKIYDEDKANSEHNLDNGEETDSGHNLFDEDKTDSEHIPIDDATYLDLHYEEYNMHSENETYSEHNLYDQDETETKHKLFDEEREEMDSGDDLANEDNPNSEHGRFNKEEVSMLIFLPNERFGLMEMEEKLSLRLFQSVTSSIRKTTVDVSLPKFKLKASYELNDVLSALGMPDAFDPDNANFAGISQAPIYISDVVHKAYVDVDERGTEAVAATAVIFYLFSGSIGGPKFVADHPFLFVIYDKVVKVPLFIGRVTSPGIERKHGKDEL